MNDDMTMRIALTYRVRRFVNLELAR